MDMRTVTYIMAYANTQNVPVQLTFENNEWTAMFKHANHAAVCFEEMKENDFDVKRRTLPDGTLVELY